LLQPCRDRHHRGTGSRSGPPSGVHCDRHARACRQGDNGQPARTTASTASTAKWIG